MTRRSIHRRRRIGAAASTAVALVALTAACETEPPPPPPVFQVTTQVDLPDADPGDGTCEATPGQGDCTLRAAVDEGNALGAADVVLPAGDYALETLHDWELNRDWALEVTGSIRISGAGTSTTTMRGLWDEGARIEVLHGGALVVEDVQLRGMLAYVVGDLALLRSQLGGWDLDDATLVVTSQGRAVVQSSWVIEPVFGYAVDNDGVTLFDNATVGGLNNGDEETDGGIHTRPGGTTYLRGTWIGAPGGCQDIGTVVSMGYNAAPDDACGLDQLTDQTDTPAVEYDYDGVWSAPPSGGLVDAIPLGEAGCGVIEGDVYGTPRPLDGDLDGTAACDIGAEELVPPVAN